MKAITVWQPWASLIAIGAKPYEFRPRPFCDYIGAPGIGERIAIHAAARPMKIDEVGGLLERLRSAEGDPPCLMRGLAEPFLARVLNYLICEREARQRRRKVGSVVVDPAEIGRAFDAETLALPYSAVVCTAELGPAARGDDCAREFGWSNDSGREGTFAWGWPMRKVRALVPPSPARGAQGFWDWREAANGLDQR